MTGDLIHRVRARDNGLGRRPDAQRSGYPEHDHVKDGQEEVYAVVAGAARLVMGDEELSRTAGTLVRVPPHVKRKWITGDEGVTLLAVGATPGKPYPAP